MATARALIASSLRQLNVLATGQTLDNTAEDDALTWLNRMIGSWGAQRLTMYFLTRTVQTLTSGTASYTIGTGGTINIVRPLTIERAGLITNTGDATPTEIPLKVFTDQEYARWSQKTLQSSYPEGIWYDHNFASSLGRIYPLPIPNVSTTQAVLYTPTALTVFADLTTDYVWPLGYEEAIETNLALRLAIPMGRPVPDLLEERARSSLALIKRSNIGTRLREMSIDPTLLGAGRGTMSQSTFDGGTF